MHLCAFHRHNSSLPYENPKLSAMAISSMSEHDFALKLDRAIERSKVVKMIEGRVVPERRAAPIAEGG
jgi:hypothetical protein